MKNKDIMKALEGLNPRSAWKRGIVACAKEILAPNLDSGDVSEKTLLNGATSWTEYSYGGNPQVYDEDICKMFCSPSEQKKKKYGELYPNHRENWLDLQARGLHMAYLLIVDIASGRPANKALNLVG